MSIDEVEWFKAKSVKVKLRLTAANLIYVKTQSHHTPQDHFPLPMKTNVHSSAAMEQALLMGKTTPLWLDCDTGTGR